MRSRRSTIFISIGFLATACFFLYLSLRPSAPSLRASDVAPGRFRATLEMASGRLIDLDTARIGTLALQGSTRISKRPDGTIVYAAANLSPAAQIAAYNTIVTPRGGQCTVILPDGTKVWLNAASALYFPTAFTGNERRISLRGEGFFLIAQDAAKPFFVKTYRDFVKSLEGEFNVNCYDDERFIKTSCLRGPIMVNGNPLTSGEAFENGLIVSTNAARDGNWKNGRFDFSGVQVEQAMRQIARWYDIELSYDLGGLPVRTLTGAYDRSLALRALLEQIQKQGLRFRLDERVLHVGPGQPGGSAQRIGLTGNQVLHVGPGQPGPNK